jgi:hypothetical protein
MECRLSCLVDGIAFNLPAGIALFRYANLYALFDNLPVVRLLDKSHADFADEPSYGRIPMDFRPYVPSMARRDGVDQ